MCPRSGPSPPGRPSHSGPPWVLPPDLDVLGVGKVWPPGRVRTRVVGTGLRAPYSDSLFSWDPLGGARLRTRHSTVDGLRHAPCALPSFRSEGQNLGSFRRPRALSRGLRGCGEGLPLKEALLGWVGRLLHSLGPATAPRGGPPREQAGDAAETSGSGPQGRGYRRHGPGRGGPGTEPGPTPAGASYRRDGWSGLGWSRGRRRGERGQGSLEENVEVRAPVGVRALAGFGWGWGSRLLVTPAGSHPREGEEKSSPFVRSPRTYLSASTYLSLSRVLDS